jgi:hypothetical protein
MTTGPTPCPVCLLPGGFHNPAVHGAHQVPAHLTWKSGEQAPWAIAQHDAALALSVAVTPENEEKLQALTVGGKRLGPSGLVTLATATAEDAETVLKGLSD